MRLRTLTLGFVLGSVCALLGANAISQQSGNDRGHEKVQHQQVSPEQQQAMMQKWMKIASPAEEHAKLAYFIGQWDTTTRMWMAPGQPPSEETGSSTFQWKYGKRFVHQTHTGNMMGMPYEGGGLTGYDNYKNKWVSTWASSMGTNISYMEGTLDQTGTVWTYFGQMDEFLTDEHDKMVKYVTRIEDDDNFVFEIHDLTIVPGETKVVEVEYTRKP